MLSAFFLYSAKEPSIKRKALFRNRVSDNKGRVEIVGTVLIVALAVLGRFVAVEACIVRNRCQVDILRLFAIAIAEDDVVKFACIDCGGLNQFAKAVLSNRVKLNARPFIVLGGSAPGVKIDIVPVYTV